MKLKVKDMDIATGGILIAILNHDTARQLDLYPEDRIRIRKGKRETIAVVDISENDKVIGKGSIGLFEEVLDKLNLKDGDEVLIDLQKKPVSLNAIKKKLDGAKLNKDETYSIIKDVVTNQLTDTELAYFVAACYTNGMSLSETVDLSKATVDLGGRLKFNKKIVVDKHCSGGVPGNRTTMVVVPILAAAGLTVPKTSSRSITSPAGTADTMEVLAPVTLSLKKIKDVVDNVGACIVWGGAVDLASADDKLIRVRHSLSLDPEGLLLSSILAKKAAVSSTHVLIDIPLGKDTKIKTKSEAQKLKEGFIKVGRKLGMKTNVIITKGTEPIGRGIGPVLEARDVLYLLKNDKRKPVDLEKKSIMMAAKLFEMAGISDGAKKAKEILESGKAYEKMKEIIKAQGGDPNIDPDKIKLGKFKYTYNSPKAGKITDIDNFTINKIARIAGAPKDKEAGIFLYKHEGEYVNKGEPVFTIYAKNKTKLSYARNILKEIGEIRVDHTYL